MKIRTLLVCAGMLGVAGAQAQLSTGMGVRGGYYLGNQFDGLTPGSHKTLEGFELGLDFSLLKLPLVELRLSPTMVFGGALSQGGDTDGYLYRATVNAKLNVPNQSWYGIVGAGYAATENRGGKQFNTENGAIGQVGLGLHSGTKLGVLQTYYELSYFFGESQLSGISFNIGVKF